MSAAAQLVFDGHNDVLLKLYRAGGMGQATSFVDGRSGAIDLPKSKVGGFGGGFGRCAAAFQGGDFGAQGVGFAFGRGSCGAGICFARLGIGAGGFFVQRVAAGGHFLRQAKDGV